MYTKHVKFKDFFGKEREANVNFNLMETEVFKLLEQLQLMFEWQDSFKGPPRELSTAEVVAFYTAFEDVCLAAYGIPSDDGLRFDKSSRYDFEGSALFNAFMVECVTKPALTAEFIEGTMPKNMEELVRTADANLIEAAKNTDNEQLQAQIALLQKQLEETRKPETS